jgi:hypothetical protein
VPSPTRGRLVALEGPSAVGKTSTGRAVAAGSNWLFLPEASALLRSAPTLEFHAPADLAAVERRLLEGERRRARATGRLLQDGVDVLLDTSPIGPATYSLGVARLWPEYRTVASRILTTVVSDLRAGRLLVPDEVLYLEAPPATLRRRASQARETHPAHLLERHWTVGAVERGFWSTLAQASLGSVRIVRTTGTPEDASSRVLSAIREPQPPLPLAVVVRELDAARRALASSGNVSVKKGASSRRPPRR